MDSMELVYTFCQLTAKLSFMVSCNDNWWFICSYPGKYKEMAKVNDEVSDIGITSMYICTFVGNFKGIGRSLVDFFV